MTLTSSERIPLEQLFAVATGKRALTVGIPAAEGPARRFPLTPEGAAMLVARDIDVRIEKGAGAAIHYTDTRYLRAGARIVSRAEAFACDIVICLSPLNPEIAAALYPTFFIKPVESISTNSCIKKFMLISAVIFEMGILKSV